MGQTFNRQTRTFSSDLYDDTIAQSEATYETNPLTLEENLNHLRSQVKRILNDSAGNWWDDIPTVNSKKRDLFDLNTDLDALEIQKVICPVQVLTNITVGGAANFVVLSVAGLAAPTDIAAVNAGTALGAIVATLAGDVGANDLTEVTGKNALSPKNMVKIRDASTKDAILSGSLEIFGLIQAESGVVDGDSFNDTDHQVQLSFVRNDGSDDLEACPAADIQGKTIEYSYPKRLAFKGLPEDCAWPPTTFSDQVASVDVTRDNAYDNQGATPVTVATNALLNLSSGISTRYRDNAAANLFSILEGSGGGTSEVELGGDVDLFDNNAVENDFVAGLKIRTGGTRPIHIGVNDGVIESVGTDKDLEVRATQDLYFDDKHQTGSTWAQTTGIKLAAATAEWDAFEVNFGEVSLLNAINQSAASSSVTKTHATVTANTAADVDVGGTGGGANLDAQIHDLSNGNFVDDHDVFVGGELLRGGANAAANNDYYPGTSLALGQIKFEFSLKGTGNNKDVIAVISRA